MSDTVRVQKLVVEELGADIAGGIANIKLQERIESLDSLTRSLPKAHILVRVMAASVNYPDLLMTCGGYQYKPKLPFIPGTEAAGVVVAAGEGSSASITNLVGTQVMFGLREGCMASHVAVPAAACTPMPQAFSFAQAASASVGFSTAYHCLVERAQLSASDSVLINGATGGVGMAAVQVARAIGCKCIIATGSGEEKLSVVAQHGGATQVIDFRNPETPVSKLGDIVKRATGGRGVDVIYDPVGGEIFDASLPGAAYGARILIVGFASGTRQTMRCNYALIKGLTVMGCRAGEVLRRSTNAAAISRQRYKDMHRWAAEGAFAPNVSHEVAAEDFGSAFRAVLDRKVVGKAVVTFTNDSDGGKVKARL